MHLHARAVLGVGIAAGVGTTTAWHSRQHSKPGAERRLRLPISAIEGISGAAGELAQICVLYPLETIKVRCQAEGISAVVVVQRLLREVHVLRQLYSGFASAAALSMLVGAVHWLSFCAAKRAALQVLPAVAPPAPAPTSSPSKGVRGAGSGGAQEAHASSSHAHHDDGSDEGAGGGMGTKAQANLFAAVCGAVATALVESPCELFRHKAQAGVISGNLWAEMATSVRHGGPLALWQGFLPFLLESFPYDMAELGSYAQLRDAAEHLARPGSRFEGLMRRVNENGVGDMVIGGCAGGTAVLLSMPFDVIKTYLQTQPALLAANTGASAQLSLFCRTGIQMVKARGPGALFVGVVPRLVQQVPSSTLCWWSVEQTQKLLHRYNNG